MEVHIVESGLFKLDGGAMFGVVPKSMWEKKNPPDANNLCTWSMRCLLIIEGNRKVLIDTGMGNKQGEKFRSHFHPHGPYGLSTSLDKLSINPEEITDVFLTHLHFDHCGGAINKNAQGDLQLAFPNATYWSNELHYNWAFEPNPRERASFLKENFTLLKDSGKIKMIDPEQNVKFMENFHIRFAYGHTEAMMLPILNIGNKEMIYCADLIASCHHIGLPYVMGYDIRPLETMAEKEALLEEAVDKNQILFFEHDPVVECATVKRNDRGRIVLNETFKFQDIL
jgi:glyoxylase-like metal-dependent hydrolase (beta-lactamase superfamily II)